MENKKIIIGLVGETGSGKDTVADYLKDKYGAKLMRFADPIKEVLGIFFEKFSKQDQQWLALQFRERFGPDILSRPLRKRVAEEKGLVVVNGIRFKEDYAFVKSFSEGVILYVTADQKLRWERVLNRGEKTDDKANLEKFQEIEMGETEVHIPKIGSRADFTIRNEKDLEFLLKSVDEIMEKLMQ